MRKPRVEGNSVWGEYHFIIDLFLYKKTKQKEGKMEEVKKGTKTCGQCQCPFQAKEDEKHCPACQTRIKLGILDGNGGTVKKPKVAC